ncbi:MAG TPA: FlgD immunoglobulin-like domain containing protein, partial [Gammaproteobacteria bacterium]|nr:FlgD immunoglobulin-like domain containing protein [Gammaproteobacteria bacterium]
DVTVSVYNAGGALVREIELGTQTKGEVRFSWDGTTDTGEYAPAGQYQVSVRASMNGEEFSPYVLTEAEVSSVSIGSGGQGLALNLKGLGPISFNDIAEIR